MKSLQDVQVREVERLFKEHLDIQVNFADYIRRYYRYNEEHNFEVSFPKYERLCLERDSSVGAQSIADFYKIRSVKADIDLEYYIE